MVEATSSSPFYVVGPTGTGKSSVALALAGRVGGEIINADAYQLYTGLDIVSAKPSASDFDRVPHHLYGCVPLGENIDAARFESLAKEAVASVAASDRLPIVVGGSGLYVKTLTHGLSPIPAADPAVRSQLETHSDEELVAKLRELDPAGAEVTNLKNRRYVIRALEITVQGGRPMSEQKNEWQNAAPPYRGVLLHRERAELYERINTRTQEMFSTGLVEEIRALGQLSETAEKAIGIREVRRLLAEEIDQPTCIANIQQATRRYAKRQVNWFRRETGFTSICITAADNADSTVGRILEAFPDLTA